MFFCILFFFAGSEVMFAPFHFSLWRVSSLLLKLFGGIPPYSISKALGFGSLQSVRTFAAKIVNFTVTKVYPPQFSLSRLRYPMASAMCVEVISSDSSRSAMVRATFNMRL